MCPLFYDQVLKAPNQEQEFTQEQIIELYKCSNDLLYFLKYVIIKTKDGRHKFDPYDFQKELVNLINNNRFICAKCARQTGKTTIVSAYLLYISIFQKDKFIGIVSNKESNAKKILREIKKSYEELPYWMKPGVVEWNKTSIEFDNGCRIETSSTNSNAFTGNTIDILFCLTENNEVTVKDKKTGKVKIIKIKDLAEELKS